MRKLLASFFFVLIAFALTAQMAPAPEEFSNPNISVGVIVSDLEKSIDFYTNVIGMTKTGGFDVDGEKSKMLGLTDGRSIEVTVLKLVDGKQTTQWKLMSFGEKANHPKQKYIHDDTGVQYITIFVNNLKPFIERIEKNNVKILSEKPSSLGNDTFLLLVQDPDGTFIELIGPHK